MAGTSTITALTAGNVTRLTGAAVLVADDSTATTVKYTAAQLRTVLFAGTAGGYTSSDPLNVGALAATTGTFSGAVSGVTTLATSGTINGQTISSAANLTGTLAVTGAISQTGAGGIGTSGQSTVPTNSTMYMDFQSGSYGRLLSKNAGGTFTDAIHVVNPLALDSTLAVTGAATLSSTLAVTGLATLSGDVNINTTTAATLNFYGSTGVYGIRVTNASGVMDLRTNSVTGLSIANSGAGVTVPGNFTVTGSATLNGGLVVAGGLTSSVGLTVGANSLITNTASGYLIVGANGGPLYLRSGTVAGAIYMQDSAGNAAPVNVSGAITSNGVISTQRGTGQAINLYSASSLGHQWDIYGSGNNLRFSDNTGGGTFAVDTAATIGGTLNVTGAATLSSTSLAIGGVSYTFPATGAAVSGYVLSSTTGGVLSWAAASGGSGTSAAFLRGSTSDTLASSGWRKVTLNNTDLNQGSIVSLSTSVITLQAGTYLFSGNVSYSTTAGTFATVQLRIRNTSDSTTAAVSPASHGEVNTGEGTAPFGQCVIVGQVVIAGAKTFELQLYGSSDAASIVTEAASGTPGLTAYAQILVEKIA